MSTIAVFLLLAGGTAFAANQLAKKSVGTKQLKANAVTTAKIKKEAVTAAKIREAAVDGSKIAAGAVTGADINAASTSFSRVTARIRTTAQAPFVEKGIYPVGGYTQNAGEDAQYLGAMDVNFPASCEAPREVVAVLLLDAADPTKPTADNILGYGTVTDTAGGAVTRRMEFAPFIISYRAMARPGPATATPHTLSAYMAAPKCKSGGGITAVGAGVDVIGTK